MKGLNRQEVIAKYREVTKKYGKPKYGEVKGVYCEEQFISSIVEVLSAYSVCNITWEGGRWDITPNSCLRAKYCDDYTPVGSVYSTEWFSEEQIRALHELAFGYQF